MREHLKKGFALLDEVEALYAQGQLEQALDLFLSHEKEYEGNYRFQVTKAVFLLEAGMVDEAIELLEKRYYLHQLHYETNYNLGYFYFVKQEYEQALQYLVKASFCIDEDGENEDLSNQVMQLIEQVCVKKPELIESIGAFSHKEDLAHKRIQDLFPVKWMVASGDAKLELVQQMVDDRGQAANTGNGSEKYKGYRMAESYLGQAFSYGDGVEYYTGIYDGYYEERDDEPVRFNDTGALFKTETIPGQRGMGKEFTFVNPVKLTVPVMMEKRFQPMAAEIIDEAGGQAYYEYRHMLEKRFYYYTFDNVKKLTISSNQPMVIGDPVMWGRKKEQPNVIINLFIDGLSQKFIEEHGFDKLMPNTARFFSRGVCCTNAFSNGEWTYPSLASYFSGLRTRNHGMYHSSFWNQNLWRLPLVTETLKQGGYLCSRFDGDWRTTPVSGYAKGMTRQLYQQAVRAMKVDDNVEEAIEQLEAFPETPQFIWLGIPDLHDAPDEVEMRLSTQTLVSPKDRQIARTNQTSVQKQYDEVKVQRYIEQLKRVDRVLETLYHYIEEHYDREDYIVSLMSDHGQGFTHENARFFLDEHRTRVPMMFCGRGFSSGTCDELMESVDFFPTVLRAAGLPPELGEGRVQPALLRQEYQTRNADSQEAAGRSYVITESIHEKRLYQAVVYDKEYACFLNSQKLMGEDESIDMTDYEVHLIRRETGEEITEAMPELAKRYEDIILKHIEEYIVRLDK